MRNITIEDLIDKNIVNLKEQYIEIKYLDTGNITDNKIDEVKTIKKNHPSRAKKIVKNNDILISNVRPNKKHYGILKNVPKNLIVSTGFTVIRVKENVVAKYVYYFLTRKKITKKLSQIAEGATTTYPSILPHDIYNIKINLPSVEEQKRIANILSSFDDKIENNLKIIETLEAIVSNVYKQWFEEFEFPNDNGLPYKSNGGKMIDSELGLIPEGWEIKELKSLCSFYNGFAFSSKDYIKKGKYSIITIRNVDNIVNVENSNLINELPIKIKEEVILEISDLLLTLTGNVGRTGIVVNENCLLNQRVAKVDSRYKGFMELYFKENEKSIIDLASGTAQQNLSTKNLENKKIVINEDRIKSFEVMYLYKIILYKENLNLIKLRDLNIEKLIK